MDYRKFGECYYIRMDRNDEIISTILEICKKENIRSATFSGIGGCKDAEIQTFIPETGSFELHPVTGGTIRRKYDPETGTGFWDFN